MPLHYHRKRISFHCWTIHICICNTSMLLLFLCYCTKFVCFKNDSFTTTRSLMIFPQLRFYYSTIVHGNHLHWLCQTRTYYLRTLYPSSGRKSNGKNHDYDKSFAHPLYNDSTKFYTQTNLANHYYASSKFRCRLLTQVYRGMSGRTIL